MIGSDHVVASGDLRDAVLSAAQSAFDRTLVGHVGKEVHVRLRHMVLLRGPPELTRTDTDTDTDTDDECMSVDAAQGPDAFARMIVQVPCVYTASRRGTVAVGVDSVTRTYTLDSRSEEGFSYVFCFSACTVRMHTPQRGCSVFLVYDVASVARIHMQARALGSHLASEALLCECVAHWERDTAGACPKLALVLRDDEWHTSLDAHAFHWHKVTNVHDCIVINAIRNCPRLDFAVAGACVHPCVYIHVCMLVCMVMCSACVCVHSCLAGCSSYDYFVYACSFSSFILCHACVHT
jgi:hypothetical protein